MAAMATLPQQQAVTPVVRTIPQDSDDESGDEPMTWVDKHSKLKEKLEEKLSRLARVFPRWLILPVLAIILIALLFAVVGPVFGAYKRDNSAQLSQSDVYCALNTTTPTPVNATPADGWCPQYRQWRNPNDVAPDAIVVSTRISDLDLPSSQATLVSSITFSGAYNDSRGLLNLANQNQSLVIYGNFDSITIPAGSRAPKFTYTVDLDVVIQLFNYPFDKYRASIIVSGHITDGQNFDNDQAVPLIHEISNNLPTYDLWNTPGEYYLTNHISEVGTVVTIERSNSTRFFSLFIVIAMWALSSSTFIMVLDLVYLRSRQVKTDDAAYVAALLFALPQVRQVQPAVPDVGASVDVLGFFWNMAITALAGVLILGGLTAQNIKKPDRVKRAAQMDVNNRWGVGKAIAATRTGIVRAGSHVRQLASHVSTHVRFRGHAPNMNAQSAPSQTELAQALHIADKV